LTAGLEDLFRTEEFAAVQPAPARGRHRKRAPIVALIPVHNELEFVDTVRAVLGQTLPPDEIYILTDNCRDERIWEIASRLPVSVSCTVGNQHKKAGNLNVALRPLLESLPGDAIVTGFDADSIPDPDFIENAVRWLNEGYGAVGATFQGRNGGGVLGQLQRSEFARFARHQHRKSSTDVLSGTGYAIWAHVLSEVAATRPDGGVYAVHHITEDFELTKAIQHAGYRAISPADCRVTTDVMETIPDWVTQRLRWQLGTLVVLMTYGWGKHTTDMIIRQIMLYLVMVATPLTGVYLVWSFLLYGWHGLDPLNAPWYAAGIAVVVAEQAWQSRKAGVWAVVTTALVLPDLVYSFARQFIYLRALWYFMRGKQAAWGAGAAL
jgi:poly-beta-1,6-N-acetyl-D-glucosamine synthase